MFPRAPTGCPGSNWLSLAPTPPDSLPTIVLIYNLYRLPDSLPNWLPWLPGLNTSGSFGPQTGSPAQYLYRLPNWLPNCRPILVLTYQSNIYTSYYYLIFDLDQHIHGGPGGPQSWYV